MELLISPNFWVFKFFKNAKERDLKIAEYLDETAEEAHNLARVWENVMESVLADGVAEVENNISWQRLVERPEWTIYSRDIPKSRLELFFERVSAVLMKNQRNGMDYIACKIGAILQKKKLTVEVIETELKRIKEARFFNKHNRLKDDITIRESILILNSEVVAIRTFA